MYPTPKSMFRFFESIWKKWNQDQSRSLDFPAVMTRRIFVKRWSKICPFHNRTNFHHTEVQTPIYIPKKMNGLRFLLIREWGVTYGRRTGRSGGWRPSWGRRRRPTGGGCADMGAGRINGIPPSAFVDMGSWKNPSDHTPPFPRPTRCAFILVSHIYRRGGGSWEVVVTKLVIKNRPIFPPYFQEFRPKNPNFVGFNFLQDLWDFYDKKGPKFS